MQQDSHSALEVLEEPMGTEILLRPFWGNVICHNLYPYCAAGFNNEWLSNCINYFLHIFQVIYIICILFSINVMNYTD